MESNDLGAAHAGACNFPREYATMSLALRSWDLGIHAFVSCAHVSGDLDFAGAIF